MQFLFALAVTLFQFQHTNSDTPDLLCLYHPPRFKVLIDGVEEVSGPLAAAEWGPALQPPETISDPQHVKPDDWVEEQM